MCHEMLKLFVKFNQLKQINEEVLITNVSGLSPAYCSYLPHDFSKSQ